MGFLCRHRIPGCYTLSRLGFRHVTKVILFLYHVKLGKRTDLQMFSIFPKRGLVRLFFSVTQIVVILETVQYFV